jgi:hypothetical protein
MQLCEISENVLSQQVQTIVLDTMWGSMVKCRLPSCQLHHHQNNRRRRRPLVNHIQYAESRAVVWLQLLWIVVLEHCFAIWQGTLVSRGLAYSSAIRYNVQGLWWKDNVTNSMAWVRERAKPTQPQPHVSEVSAKFSGERGVTLSRLQIPYGRNLRFLDRSHYSFFQVILTRLTGPRTRPITSRKIW